MSRDDNFTAHFHFQHSYEIQEFCTVLIIMPTKRKNCISYDSKRGKTGGNFLVARIPSAWSIFFPNSQWHNGRNRKGGFSYVYDSRFYVKFVRNFIMSATPSGMQNWVTYWSRVTHSHLPVRMSQKHEIFFMLKCTTIFLHCSPSIWNSYLELNFIIKISCMSHAMQHELIFFLILFVQKSRAFVFEFAN